MRDVFIIALRAISCNRLRSALTIAIIAAGIMSIVGIQTAISILSEGVAGSFARIGGENFTVRIKPEARPLNLSEALCFKKLMAEKSEVAVFTVLSEVAQIKSGKQATDPVSTVISADENYIASQHCTIESGRNISDKDIRLSSSTAVIGDNVKKKLFGSQDCIYQKISANGLTYTVTGVIKRQGALLGMGLDNSIVTPLVNHGEIQLCIRTSADINLKEEASSAMRRVRHLSPEKEDDFEIVRSDYMQQTVQGIRSKLSAVALLAGIISMIGAAVGLMNIMLVSVKERTREIGIRKAVGAKNGNVRMQFLTEAAIIGEAGCMAGVLLGITAGNVLALYLECEARIPWNWIVFSAVICLAVSLLSGIFPAIRAETLDPVDALHDN